MTMHALAERFRDWFGVRLTPKTPPEPEALRAAPRPMTGFLALLTPEQRAAALAYCGDDAHGDLDLRLDA